MQLVEFVEDAADIFIEVLDHSRVGGVVLNLPYGAAVVVEELGGFACWLFGRLGFVFFQQSGLRLQRVVDGVVREVNEERLLAILLDEADCLAGEAVGEVFPLRSVGQIGQLIWTEVGGRSPLAASAQIDVEALVFGPMLGRIAEVPFSKERGSVAAGFQCLGEGGFFGREAGWQLGALELLRGLVFSARQPIGDAQACGIFSGENARAGWGADRRGRIGIGEAHAFFGEAIQIGSFVKGAAVASEVSPAEIIDQDENYVWLSVDRGRDREQANKEEVFH